MTGYEQDLINIVGKGEEKKPKECLEDIISRTFEDVKQKICDDYCRFTVEKSNDEIENLWDSDICNNCPLNDL